MKTQKTHEGKVMLPEKYTKFCIDLAPLWLNFLENRLQISKNDHNIQI